MMDRMVWLLCPICGNKTRLKVRQDTELINTFPALTLAAQLVRVEKFIYGNVKKGDELVKGVEAGVLAPVLNIHDGARGDKHFVAYFLAPCPRRLYRCPKSLEVVFRYWSFCHDYSPYYILLFTFLLGYVYTILSVSQNNSYYRYTVFWNGENWVKVSINPLTKANKPPIMTI